MMSTHPAGSGDEPLWRPTQETLDASALRHYLDWLGRRRGLEFGEYRSLWEWSVTDLAGFWSSVWEFFGLDRVSRYDAVLAEEHMPGARWFTGARINFAERCLANEREAEPAVVAVGEDAVAVPTSWTQLRREVAAVAATLRELGVQPGDYVAGYLPNIAEAVVAVLATAAIGAVWTAASPDFGTPSVLARLAQARPVVLIAADGYRYGGKEHERTSTAAELVAGLPSVRALITIGHLRPADATAWLPASAGTIQVRWAEAVERDAALEFADVPFGHPLWTLWSSGTTGAPKGITHGHGGITVELLKALALGCDVRAGDRYFFVTSTSWMVWNFLVGGLLLGATIICYDGSPSYPDVDGAWRIAEATGADVVGVGAGYLIAGHKAGATPAQRYDLRNLRSILQTGSTLPAESWQWTSAQVRPGVWLQSVCGGTDICSALAAASPLLPVYAGRISAPALGVALEAWDEQGRPVVGEQGELVVTRPLPSMPLYLLGDPEGSRYHDSYFATYPGVWRHGDWIVLGADQSVTVLGRSDSTLNRMGVRMGSADIYAVLDQIPEIADSLVLGIEQPDGGYSMPLYVVPSAGAELDHALRARIVSAIRTQLSPRHVPDAIIQAPAIPRTLTGKRLEVPVKRILQGDNVSAGSPGAITHPEALAWFAAHAGTTSPA